MHKSITYNRVLAVVTDNEQNLGSTGLCISCGAEAEGVEPDARKYECEACGERAVYGAEELLMAVAPFGG